jgi:hypothetical protein
LFNENNNSKFLTGHDSFAVGGQVSNKLDLGLDTIVAKLRKPTVGLSANHHPSEARGLWLFWVIRGGIGLTRRLGAACSSTRRLMSEWILSLEPEHRQKRWVTTEA